MSLGDIFERFLRLKDTDQKINGFPVEYERKFDGVWQAGWSALGISRRKCSHTFAGVSSPWQGFLVKMNVLGEG